MRTDIEKVFSRQYKRMESELVELNIPQGYLSIVSKYWKFAEEDIKDITENEDGLDKDTNR